VEHCRACHLDLKLSVAAQHLSRLSSKEPYSGQAICLLRYQLMRKIPLPTSEAAQHIQKHICTMWVGACAISPLLQTIAAAS